MTFVSVLRTLAEGKADPDAAILIAPAARAQAAFEGADTVGRAHLKAVAASALSHRLRRDPLDEAGSGTRVARIVAEVLP